MIPKNFKEKIVRIDSKFEGSLKENFLLPSYDPQKHYLDLTQSGHYRALTILRHVIKSASDYYWSEVQGAYNVDLFMMTPSVSSPSGSGSDSEAIPIKFGNLETNLVDSSQFGFEPLMMNNIEKLNCYLPSMRGENPDNRHLNQFYHCEAEILGDLGDLTPQIEGYVVFLAETLLLMKNTLSILSENIEITTEALEGISSKKSFVTINFDDAVKYLKDNGQEHFYEVHDNGIDISPEGEKFISINLGEKTSPVWIKNFDRDRVPFYQKPDPNDTDKVLNADLVFPSLTGKSFGGEIVGCGQRQNDVLEMIESLSRQGIAKDDYEWYLDLRRQKDYKTTSGFGIGIERFLAWALCGDDIKNYIHYPRIKNVITYP